MKKGLVTVFIVIGILVLGLIIWAVVFNGGFQGAFKAISEVINNIWGGMTGNSGSDLIDANTLVNGSNFKNLGDTNSKKAFGGT